MKITIYQNREVYKEESKIGNDSENKVETLEFEFPEEYRDFTKYIEFQIKGEKYVDLIEDNKYVITREVAKYGKIKTQVVLKKNTENDVMIFKSDVFTLTVSNSINATEDLVYTVGVDLIEKIVTKNSEQDVRLDALEADNTTNKENILNLQNDNITNKTNIKSLQDDNEVNKTDISNIKQEQTVQNTNIQELQTDNTSNKSKIVNLEMKNAEQDNKIVSLETKNTQQDTSIQTNTKSIEEINKKDKSQDNLIEELQTENTKLKKTIESMQVPGEATGNPIHISDSSDMECEIVPIGNAEQETREGYNILNPTNLTLFNSNKYISTIDYLSTGAIEVDSNTTYSLIRKKDGTFADAGFYVYDSNNSNKTSASAESVVNGNYKVTKFTTKSDSKYFGFYFGETEKTYTSVEECLLQNEMMLLKGDYSTGTIPKYEQYGAMPSPNYPSKVVTVGQNVQLFDKDNVENGYFYTNIKVANTNWCNYETTALIAGKTYTTSGGRCIISFFNGDTNISYQDITDKTITVPENTNKVYISVPIESINTFKIEAGTIATPYSPYGQGSVEIGVVNDNFFNFDKLTVTGREESEVTFDKELGKIEATASTSDKYLLKSFTMKGLTVGETYTIGFKHKTKNCTFGGNGIFRLSSTVSFNSYDYGYVNGSTSETYSSKTFVATTDTFTLSFLGVNGTAPSDTCTMYAKDIMLVKGATDKNYIQNQAQIKVLPIQKEFVKIGDVEDTFVKVDGKWYEKHDIPKYIFTGNESFSRGSTRNGFYYFEATISDLAGNYGKINRILCNVAKEISASDMNEVTSQKNLIGTNLKNIRLMLSNINTVAELQAYLSEQYANETPATLYYLSTTPKLIECTQEQIDILNSFYTYKGITNVSMSGIGTLKVNYKKDLETIINKLSATSVAE